MFQQSFYYEPFAAANAVEHSKIKCSLLLLTYQNMSFCCDVQKLLSAIILTVTF